MKTTCIQNSYWGNFIELDGQFNGLTPAASLSACYNHKNVDKAVASGWTYPALTGWHTDNKFPPVSGTFSSSNISAAILSDLLTISKTTEFYEYFVQEAPLTGDETLIGFEDLLSRSPT